MQHVSGRQEEVWPREFAWVFGMLYNQKEKGFTENIYLGLCVCSSAIFKPLYSTHPSILGNKKKKTQIRVLFISVVTFLCYTTKVYFPQAFFIPTTKANILCMSFISTVSFHFVFCI